MARGCSPKGVVKKHNLYNKQPKDWGRGGERRKEEGRGEEGRGEEGRGGERRGGEGRGGDGRGEEEGSKRWEAESKRLHVCIMLIAAELRQLPPSPHSTLTQMSDFVVIFYPLYRFTISGDQ